MSRWLNTFFLVFKVSLRSFWVKKTFWLGIILFALCVLILFPFSLGTEEVQRQKIQIGCLWAILEFVSALCIGRMFSVEQEANALDILLSSRSFRSAILFAKIAYTTLFLFSLQIAIILFWMLFFNVSPQHPISFVKGLLSICFFFSFGSASLGSFVYALTTRSLAKEILQPILFFPLQTGLLLASVSLSLSLNSLNSMSHALDSRAWWSILILVPVIFSAIGWIFSSTLLEE